LLAVLLVAAALVAVVQLRRRAPPEAARLLPGADGFFYVNLKWLRTLKAIGQLPPVPHDAGGALRPRCRTPRCYGAQSATSTQLVLIEVDLGQHADLKVVLEVHSRTAMRGNNVASFEAHVRRVRSTGDGHLRTELPIDFGLGEMNSFGCYAQHLIEARPMPDLMGKK
jgi:hypothetical protein